MVCSGRMFVRRFTTQLGVALRGRIDTEQRIARATKWVTVKGMFLTSHAGAIGDRWAQVAPKLVSAPREGRYMPYADYPLADYYRVVFEGSAAAFPALPLPEACRQASRAHMRTFAASTVGSVMLAMISDVRGALLALPDMFARGSHGIGVRAEPSGNGVRVDMENIGGVQDCSAIGTLEGCVLHYGRHPVIDVQILSNEHAAYIINWL